MQYASMSDLENTTPVEAREFVGKLMSLRLYAGGPIYVCPMGQEAIDGELPLLDKLSDIGENTQINAQIKHGNTFLNVKSLMRFLGKGTPAELMFLASCFGINELDAYKRIPGFPEAVTRLIRNA